MKNTDLIIFGGQSNMQGQTDSAPVNDDCVEGALEYRFLNDSLAPFKDPVGENIGLDGKEFPLDITVEPQSLWRDPTATIGGYDIKNPCRSQSMLPDFCREYRERTGKDVVAVHAAKGATVIEYWQKGGGAYNILVKKRQKPQSPKYSRNVYISYGFRAKAMLLTA